MEEVTLVGAAEVARTFRALSRDHERDFLAELKVAGEFVRDDARQRLRDVGPGARAVGAKYRVRIKKNAVSLAVLVDNPLRKVTGLRPDWGPTQMRVALLPALEAKRPEVEETLENAVFALPTRYGL